MTRPDPPSVADLLDADRRARDEAQRMRQFVLSVRCPTHDAPAGRPCGHLPTDGQEGTVCSDRVTLWLTRHQRRQHKAGRLPPAPPSKVPPMLVRAHWAPS